MSIKQWVNGSRFNMEWFRCDCGRFIFLFSAAHLSYSFLNLVFILVESSVKSFALANHWTRDDRMWDTRDERIEIEPNKTRTTNNDWEMLNMRHFAQALLRLPHTEEEKKTDEFILFQWGLESCEIAAESHEKQKNKNTTYNMHNICFECIWSFLVSSWKIGLAIAQWLWMPIF